MMPDFLVSDDYLAPLAAFEWRDSSSSVLFSLPADLHTLTRLVAAARAYRVACDASESGAETALRELMAAAMEVR
jgi:hypothetical protein